MRIGFMNDSKEAAKFSWGRRLRLSGEHTSTLAHRLSSSPFDDPAGPAYPNPMRMSPCRAAVVVVRRPVGS